MAFGDITGEARPLWRDVSSHNYPYDPEVAVANGVNGFIIRAGYGLVKDTAFHAIWDAVGLTGKPRTTYWAFYPQYSIAQQVQYWLEQHPVIEPGHPCRWMDIEVAGNLTNAQIGNAVAGFSDRLAAHDNQRAGIYTNYWRVNDYFAAWPLSYLLEHLYWLAQYRTIRSLEHAGPPILPRRVPGEYVILHQTADKKRAYTGEAPENVDWDRWLLGNEAQMLIFMNERWGWQIRRDWYADIDRWARMQGFDSPFSAPGDSDAKDTNNAYIYRAIDHS